MFIDDKNDKKNNSKKIENSEDPNNKKLADDEKSVFSYIRNTLSDYVLSLQSKLVEEKIPASKRKQAEKAVNVSANLVQNFLVAVHGEYEKLTKNITEITDEVNKNISSQLHKMSEKFLSAVESSSSYTAHNKKSNCLGKYQLQKHTALVDIGWVDRHGGWTKEAKSHGVNSTYSFLHNPKAQEIAYKELKEQNHKYFERFGLDKFIGEVVHGVEITQKGVDFALQFGIGNLKKFLEKGIVSYDGNGVPITTYITMGNVLEINPEKLKNDNPLQTSQSVSSVVKIGDIVNRGEFAFDNNYDLPAAPNAKGAANSNQITNIAVKNRA